MNIDNFKDVFNRFGERVKNFTSPVSSSDIIVAERFLGLSLPQEYKDLLAFSNGISIMGDEIYGVGEASLGMSLETVYQFEHFEVENPMPLHLIPFCPDGFGNHYCFDSINGGIVFWQHDIDYSQSKPEPVYATLFDMIKEVLIDWTLKYWDYNGNRLDV